MGSAICVSFRTACPLRLEEWWKRRNKELPDEGTEGKHDLDENYKLDDDISDVEQDQFRLEKDMLADIMRIDEVKSASNTASKAYGLEFFVVGPRGTDDTIIRKGVEYDSIRAEPCHPDAVDFCLLYLPQRSATYGTLTMFSVADADFLARMWACKAEFFFRIWNEHDCSKTFHFNQGHLDSWVEPHAFVTFATGFSEEPKLRERLRQAQNVQPKLGEPNFQKFNAYHASKKAGKSF